MHRFLDHGRLPGMNGEWTPRGVANDTGTGWVLGGRYRLISQVGAGGMAVVWQAHDSVLARTVAVKVLAARHSGDPDSRDRIRQEARAAAVLSHPNIAQVYDYGEADIAGEVMPYVVMELVRGATLHQRLTEGPVLARYAMRICAEVAAALAVAHAEGLAHRDIKPANVMLAPTGAKVVDFGIAAAIRPPGSGATDFEVLGTPAYLAPERLLDDAVEPASDVYALGVLLYRLLAGHSPWTLETTTQMLSAHIYLEPTPLLPMFQVPEFVTALCNRCLAKDPAQRPSAREAAALLAHGAGLQVITDEPAPTPDAAAIDPEPSVLIRPPASIDPAPADPVPPIPDAAASADPQPASPDAAALVGPPISRPDDDAPGDAPEPEAVPSGAGQATSAPPKKLPRSVYAVAAAILLVAVAAALWLRSAHRDSVVSAAPPSATASAAGPGASRAAVNPLPGASTATATTVPGGPVPGPTIVISVAKGHPAPGRTAPATVAPRPTVTATEPATQPVERTLSSSAGSVRATCPAADTAQILSWTATKPYRVVQGDREAGSSPAVSFKHGNTEVTMTVTCDDGVPSATSA
jgi:serine/threonine protein kinase